MGEFGVSEKRQGSGEGGFSLQSQSSNRRVEGRGAVPAQGEECRGWGERGGCGEQDEEQEGLSEC